MIVARKEGLLVPGFSARYIDLYLKIPTATDPKMQMAVADIPIDSEVAILPVL